MAERLLKDIISVPPIQLVVDLEEAENSSEELLKGFVLTEDVRRALEACLKRFAADRGTGILLKGNFGSGKSHFLAFLYLLLKGHHHPVLEGVPELKDKDFSVYKVSLVRYPAKEPLERIVLRTLGIREDVFDRQEAFRKAITGPTVLLIDELSEFLRSKPDARAFYEDIRFLQFLGEFAGRSELYIVAALQEWIEETGHISSSLFQRIKDRYPVRLTLTASHIEDIIDQRVVLKAPQAERHIEEVYLQLKRYYPNLGMPFGEFKKTYPLHPFTVRLLSGVTPLLSQRRGIIQFVHERTRAILDEPLDRLITPEEVFDHFEDRLRELPEFSPLIRVAYDYYRRHIREVLPDDRQAELGLRSLKIMVLTEVSPYEKRKTAEDLAEMLLPRISTLREDINYRFLREAVLEPLVRQKMFVVKEADTYYIDVSREEGLKVRAALKKQRERFTDEVFLAEALAEAVNLPYLPLSHLREGRRYRFRWQASWRWAFCLYITGQLNASLLQRAIRNLEEELDGVLLVLPPHGRQEAVLSLLQSIHSNLKTALVFWLPRPMEPQEREFIEEFLASRQLSDRFPELASTIREKTRAFNQTVTDLYYEGRLIYGDGEVLERPTSLGLLPFDKLIGQVLDRSLRQLHPLHMNIMPRMEFYSEEQLRKLYREFILKGKLSIEEADKKALTGPIRDILGPLGLVRTRGRSYVLEVSPEEALIKHLLETIGENKDWASLVRTLRKGQWGLTEEQIHLIVACLSASGQVGLYSGDEPVKVTGPETFRQVRISRVKKARTLPEELLRYLPRGAFIWSEVESPPGPETIKQMHRAIKDFLRGLRKMVEEIEGLVEKYRGYSAFRFLSMDASVLGRAKVFLSSFRARMDETEAVTTMLSYLRQSPELQKEVEYLKRLHRLLREEFPEISRFYLYLNHPSVQKAEELRQQRADLLQAIGQYLSTAEGDFETITTLWERFHEDYINLYHQRHEMYYSSEVFGIKDRVLSMPETELLRRISKTVQSITFEADWWYLQSVLSGLPSACNFNLRQELELSPVCRCNFQFDTPLPEAPEGIEEIPLRGIEAFLALIRQDRYRESIDAYCLGLKDEQIRQALRALLEGPCSAEDMEKLNGLLSGPVLEHIDRALRGQWKLRTLVVDDFVERIRGRRMTLEELHREFLRWAGQDSQCIVHIKSRHPESVELLQERLALYGVQTDEVLSFMENSYQEGIPPEAIERINLKGLSTDRLIELLETEPIDTLRRHLRKELYYRFRAGERPPLHTITDPSLKALLRAVEAINLPPQENSTEEFVRRVCPLGLCVFELQHRGTTSEDLPGEVLEELQRHYENALKGITPERDPALEERIRQSLKGVVFVIDGLRYDLWQFIRPDLEEEGYILTERAFVMGRSPDTESFRQWLFGSEDIPEGVLYIKWGEKALSKRRLREFLSARARLKVLHLHLIDQKVHGATIDPYPLFRSIRTEFSETVLPLLRQTVPCQIISDHGFVDTGRFGNRYTHGGDSPYELIVPFIEVTTPLKL